MSTFFHTRAASELRPEQAHRLPSGSQQKRGILHERSASDLNKGRPTIRLVDPDVESPAHKQSPFPRLPSQVLKPTQGSKHDIENLGQPGVSGLKLSHKPSMEQLKAGLVPKPLTLKKYDRFSTLSDSTTTSQADTLIDSLFSPTSSSHRHSYDATLRGTPTVFEGGKEEEEHLEPLEENVDDSPTYHSPLASDSDSGNGSSARHGHHGSEALTALPAPPKSPSTAPYFDIERPPTPPRHSRRKSSATLGSIDSPSFGPHSPQLAPRSGTQASLPELAATPPEVPARQRAASDATENVIRVVRSTDSINAQYATVRPPTAKSQSASSLWTTESADSLPQLSVPRKRSRSRMHSASASMSALPPFMREQNYSSHLSTIPSESERNTTFISQSSAVNTSSPYRRRTISTPSVSSSYSSSPVIGPIPESESDSEEARPGVMRNQSAIPEPLFSSSSAPVLPQGRTSVRIISMTRESDEGDDTIAELQPPPLRQKRSGYLPQQRSQPEMRPESRRSVQSHHGSNRGSQSSIVFPQWAKSFYQGGAVLASAAASVVSLNRATPSQSQSTLAPMTPQQQKQQMPMIFRPFHPWHSRNQSTNTNGSRLDTPMTARTYRTYDSNWTAASPGSSHFLPSIFRPRTRPRAYTDLTERTDYTTQTDFTAATDFTNGDYETITSSQEDDFSSRSDSMSISIAQPVTVTSHGRAFARGSFRQTLRNKPSFAPPVELPDNGVGVSLSSRHSAATRNVTPRNITPGSQRQRAATTSTAEYPRHLSLDRSFVAPPHLAPTKRASYALSAWKAPSFNDDLGTLVKERGNRQILLFCLGFLCPLLWILAAVLPLPEQPVEELGVDGEKIVGMQSGEDWTWEAEKRYMKAKWWRTLNRIMSVVGVGVVAAIIALAVVAST
ncbi:hypothetical protein M8818_006111 [Zalaria obscura]|uniref:Uncharacterized protein n=1 Tax=Zalaria obscura TaxID=2024903 RepID=A0ACC3S7L5_9PEZI